MGSTYNRSMLENVSKNVIRAFEPFIIHRNVKVLGFIRWDKHNHTWIYFMFGKKLLCACFNDQATITDIAVYGAIDVHGVVFNSIVTDKSYITQDIFYTADGSLLEGVKVLSKKSFKSLKNTLNNICGDVEVYQI